MPERIPKMLRDLAQVLRFFQHYKLSNYVLAFARILEQYDIRDEEDLRAWLKWIPCRRDTDGDGNCGQPGCPRCEAREKMEEQNRKRKGGGYGPDALREDL